MRRLRLRITVCLLLCGPILSAQNSRWTEKQANDWYAKQPWLVGANYVPSSAINELEMFQAETFDPAINDRELGLAEGIGMNTMRVFLQDQLWTQDPDGFSKRPPGSVRSIRRSRACTTRAGCRARAWTSWRTRATTPNYVRT